MAMPWTTTLKLMLSPKMAAMFALGFSSGFPFYIVKDVLKAQMTDAGVNIETIGLFSAVSLPYTLKFLWSPLMDAYTPPLFGRRRGWMAAMQLLLLASIAAMGLFDAQNSLHLIGVTALAIAFFGASQDIALDAFRREYLDESELGFGTGVWMNAWRLGMYASVGGAFLASDFGFSYQGIYLILSLFMIVGIATTLIIEEPPASPYRPRSLKESVVAPFAEFLQRREALLVLSFILFYKMGDSMAAAMNIPFLLKQGYSKTEYLVIVKGIGMFGLFGGVLLGGAIMIRLGIEKSLWIFGVLQAVSTAFFAIIVCFDHASPEWDSIRLPLLGAVVGFEFLSSGMGQAAYASYMALQTDRRFTATQYALLSSLMAVPGSLAAAVTGFMVAALGWAGFYVTCALLALPGMLLLTRLAPWRSIRNHPDQSH